MVRGYSTVGGEQGPISNYDQYIIESEIKEMGNVPKL